MTPITILLIVLGALLLFCAVGFATTHWMYKQNFERHIQYPTVSALNRYSAYADRYPRAPHTFYSGKNRLQGYLYGAENTGALLVFAHGIGAGHESYIKEILWMVDHGWRVFAYDATGSCESEGKGTVGLVQSALDLNAALSYIESDKTLSDRPVCLMGHSWGGYAASAVLNFPHKVTASVSISGYNRAVEMIIQYACGVIGPAGHLLYPFAYLENKAAFGNLASLNAVDGINKSGVPVMIVHGSDDKLIPTDKVSILSYAERIQNPQVVYYIADKENQDGHNSIFDDEKALEHLQEVYQRHRLLRRQYRGRIPKEVEADFINAEYDRALCNLPNDALLSRIHAFLTEQLPR